MTTAGITLTLRLSESLLSLLRDAGRPLPESLQIRVERGSTVGQVLNGQGISPLLVPMVSLDSRRVDMDLRLETDATLTLYGPLAGG